MNEMIKRIQELKVEAIYGHQKHFLASERKDKVHKLIGIPLLILNISIGTALFALFDSKTNPDWKYIPIIFSYVAAILTGLQTFLGYEKQVLGHQNIGLKYQKIDKDIRNLESIWKTDEPTSDELKDLVTSITDQILNLNKEALAFRTNKKDYLKTQKLIQSGNQSYNDDELNL